MLQISIHWEIVIINTKGSIVPSLSKFKVISQHHQTGVPKPVYATVLTVKVSEFIRFWYPHPTNFDGSVSLQRQPSMFSYYEARIYRKLLPLEIHISSRNYGQVRKSASKNDE